MSEGNSPVPISTQPDGPGREAERLRWYLDKLYDLYLWGWVEDGSLFALEAGHSVLEWERAGCTIEDCKALLQAKADRSRQAADRKGEA